MKKTITILLIVSSGIAASAQTYLDAYNFSFNDYYGTARSVAMGNALTAVGGDIGSVAINPAGSAVAGYSQVSLTPGFSVSNTVSQGTAMSGEINPYGFEDQLKSSKARFTLPSVGATFNFNTRRSRGVKDVSIGFIYSTSNVYLNSLSASGTNSTTRPKSVPEMTEAYAHCQVDRHQKRPKSIVTPTPGSSELTTF